MERLEQLARELTPEDIKNFLDKNMHGHREMMSRYKCAMMEVETKFRVLDEEFSLAHDRNPIESIKTRLKSPNSIYSKVRKKGYPATTEAVEENIRDVAGVRVICSFLEDIYFLADCLLKQDDITLLERKDYIMNPKSNGYRSLHLIVEVPIFLQNEKRPMKVEVQLRTIAMDFWASLEHKLRYKKDLSPELLEELSQELNECAKISALVDKRMENIKNRIAHGMVDEVGDGENAV